MTALRIATHREQPRLLGLVAPTHHHQAKVRVSRRKRHVAENELAPKIKGHSCSRCKRSPLDARPSAGPGHENQFACPAVNNLCMDRCDTRSCEADVAGITAPDHNSLAAQLLKQVHGYQEGKELRASETFMLSETLMPNETE